MKIDIVTLKKFLDYCGCGMYFRNDPFVGADITIKINDIDDGKLLQWIEDYNDMLDREPPSEAPF